MSMDFTLTYPVYVPMRTAKLPWSVRFGEGRAVVVLTDVDLLNRFLQRNYGTSRRLRAVFGSGRGLFSYLTEALAEGWPTLTHVLLDPTDLGGVVRSCSLPAFLELIRRDDPASDREENSPGQPG
jgi:hypothetical protein